MMMRLIKKKNERGIQSVRNEITQRKLVLFQPPLHFLLLLSYQSHRLLSEEKKLDLSSLFERFDQKIVPLHPKVDHGLSVDVYEHQNEDSLRKKIPLPLASHLLCVE